jgi:hypothetical protein
VGVAEILSEATAESEKLLTYKKLLVMESEAVDVSDTAVKNTASELI